MTPGRTSRAPGRNRASTWRRASIPPILAHHHGRDHGSSCLAKKGRPPRAAESARIRPPACRVRAGLVARDTDPAESMAAQAQYHSPRLTVLLAHVRPTALLHRHSQNGCMHHAAHIGRLCTKDPGRHRQHPLACTKASIHRRTVIGIYSGLSARKVPSELGRWECLKLPAARPRGHLSDAIVA